MLKKSKAIQATTSQGKDHDATVRELNWKFLCVLVALGFSMLAVVIAAVALIWVKDPSGEGEAGTYDQNNYVAITSSTIVVITLALTSITMIQMVSRLHTPAPTSSSLTLSTKKGNSYTNVHEFYVGAGSDVTPKRSNSAHSIGRLSQ